jgi:hypothetical protein
LLNDTVSPTFLVTKRPTKLPVSLTPSRYPTLLPSRKPSISPSLAPTKSFSPTMIPTLSPSTLVPSKKPSLKPSHTSYPSFLPSSSPSLSFSSQGKTVVLTEGTGYEGEYGAEQIIIASQGNINIKGNKGKKHYIILSSIGVNITITIVDFKSSVEEDGEGDVLDFSELSSFTYSYSTNPLMFHLLSPYHITIVLSSHADFDLRSENVRFPSTSSTSGSFFYTSVQLPLFSAKLILLIACIPSAFILTFFVANYRRKSSEKLKDTAVLGNKPEENLSESLGSSFLSSYNEPEKVVDCFVPEVNTYGSIFELAESESLEYSDVLSRDLEDYETGVDIKDESNFTFSSLGSFAFHDFELEEEFNDDDSYGKKVSKLFVNIASYLSF